MPYYPAIIHYLICYHMLKDIGLLGKIYGKCKGSMLHWYYEHVSRVFEYKHAMLISSSQTMY